MRTLWLAPLLAIGVLVLGAWTSASNTAPACTAQDRQAKVLVRESGYALACGPGLAIVKVKGTTYRIQGSRCFIGPNGGRLYFGTFWFNSSPQPAARNSLYLTVDRKRKQGPGNVSDGGFEVVTRANGVLDGTPAGKVYPGGAGLERGTFAVVARDGPATGVRLTGSWDCG